MRWTHVLSLLFALAVVAGLVAAFGNPPEALGEGAAPDVFSAGRALADVRGLTSTGKPHPAAHYDGTPRTPEEIADHARAQAYVMDRLRALGLSPEVQKGNACGRFVCADAENVVARMEGEGPGPAVMLVAHYDSTPMGPGAADDGAGVASILETVRALRAGPKPKRPLIVLIDDGEEMGLLGARVFSSQHPWAKDVGVVLNFEARGTSGQAAMFETSNGNGELFALFAGAVERPVASSVIYTMYKRLPNDTDLSIFKQAGMAGLNFAFADRVFDYHTPGDTPDELDPRSVQHIGSQMLAVTRALLFAPELPKPSGDAVYFDVLSLGIVRYPAWSTGPLAVLVALGAAFVIARSVKRNSTTMKRVLLAAAVWLGALVASTLAGVLVALALKSVRFPNVGKGPLAMRAMMGDHHPMAPWLALVLVSAATSTAFALWLCPRVKAPDAGAKSGEDGAKNGDVSASKQGVSERDPIALAGGALVVWMVFSLLLGFAAPGASYLFTLVGIVAVAGFAVASSAPGSAETLHRGVAIALIPAALVWFPIVRVMLIMVGGTMAPASTLPILFMATLFTPLLAASPPRIRWSIPIAAGALTLIAVVAACVIGPAA